MGDKSASKRIMITDWSYFLEVLAPSFKEVEGLILFEAHFSTENFEEYWKDKAHQEPEKIENTINHVHLDDICSNKEGQETLATAIKDIWRTKLSQRFPTKEFKIEIHEQDQNWLIYAFQKRD